jgi:translation initiation factor 4A
MYDSFDDMGLNDNLIRGVYSYGFETPSKIQQLAIVPMSKHTDILAQSQSGTGKTGAFTIGSLSVVDISIKAPQVLVICPTRELSQQTERVARALGSHMGLRVLSATGGNQLRSDISALKSGAQFIVGTPGRIYDLIRRGDLTVDNIRYVILDEADQMLEDLFAEQIKAILDNKFPTNTHLALFSATMPQNVLEVAENYLNNPVRILLPPDEVTLDGIKQFYVTLNREEWKLPALLDLYQQIAVNQALIYVNKRQKAEWLAKQLAAQGFTLEFIHGEMEVSERKKRMEDFRSGAVRVLISTDLLARGIDVQQVSLVINYELPIQRENYVHRIGRSGRYGKKGVAINLVYGEEQNVLKEIERHYSTNINELPEDLASLSAAC